VLSLNQVDSADLPPAQLFQFSLSPEDEARQAADRAWSEGLRSPIVLTPADDWGDRLQQAFIQRWTELGGLVVDQDRYDPNEVDHTKIIRRLMGYRERQVEGKRKPQPERRTDIDFIFIVAKPEQAQQIRPQLLYFLAGDLPIYATSHAWRGHLTAQQARDMAGIQVPEIPWLATDDSMDPLSQAALSRLLPASTTAYAPLYAMGIDAYQLLPHLNRLQSGPTESLPGKTGILSLNERHQVLRQMIWLRIDKVPQVLGYSPRIGPSGVDATPSPPLENEVPLGLPADLKTSALQNRSR
jgi:outer membrane PBP1 activator LpoA protein